MKARVFIVEDHPITSEGLRLLIGSQADLQVCGCAADGVAALTDIDKEAPDVIVTDLSLGGMDGIEFIKHVHARHVNIPILVLSMHDETLYAQRSIRAGARGYVMKNEAPALFLTALRRVLKGGIFLSEQESARALQGLATSSSDPSKAPVEQLSDRELEVFRWLGQGCSLREIAAHLNLSVKTVETHCSHIKTKLGIGNSRELLRAAVHFLEADRP